MWLVGDEAYFTVRVALQVCKTQVPQYEKLKNATVNQPWKQCGLLSPPSRWCCVGGCHGGVPETTPKVSSSLGKLPGLRVSSNSWIRLVTGKRTHNKISPGIRHVGQNLVFARVLPQWHHTGQAGRLQKQVVTAHVPELQAPRREAGIWHKPRCLHSLGTEAILIDR